MTGIFISRGEDIQRETQARKPCDDGGSVVTLLDTEFLSGIGGAVRMMLKRQG